MAMPNGSAADVVLGPVESKNEHGIKVAGDWRNVSKFRPVELPAIGANVRLELDAKGFIKSLEVLDAAPAGVATSVNSARDQRITRLAVLKAAAQFGASRDVVKSYDVLRIADAWLEWVEQSGA